jgi:predicted dehydrogenase
MKRRTFLKTAATAVVTPMIIPSTALGQNAPSNRINLAIIGVGGRGTDHVDYVSTLKEAQLLAVCDCFQTRREGTRDRLNAHYDGNFVTAYSDYREVLARDDIDGIIVATPDHWHVHVAIAAARAKKHMYVEKPLSISMEWAWKLREEVKKNEVVFQYGTQQRSQFQFRQACELVRNGYIGEVERVDTWCEGMGENFEGDGLEEDGSATVVGSTAPIDPPEGLDYNRWLGPAAVKPYTADRCTFQGSWHVYDYALGFIAGWGAHPLDIAQWGLDTDHTSPVRYEGTGMVSKRGLFDTIESWDMECTYASGLKMRFQNSRKAKEDVTAYRRWNDHGTTFFGSEGWVSVDRGSMFTSEHKLRGIKLKPDDIHLRRSQGHPDDFIACIKSGEPTLSPLEAGIRSDTICHLSDIAIRLGRTIDWDPKKERILGNPLAQAMLDRPIRAPWNFENL